MSEQENDKPAVHPSQFAYPNRYVPATTKIDQARFVKIKPGRLYTPELADKICELIAEGVSLREIAKRKGFPDARVIKDWIVDNEQGFQEMYAKAKRRYMLDVADEILQISDNPEPTTRREVKSDGSWKEITWDSVERSQLKLRNRQWMLTKLMPTVYGDARRVELMGPDGAPIEMTENERAAKIAAFVTIAQQRADEEAKLRPVTVSTSED